MNSSATAYSPVGEISGDGYTAGGKPVTMTQHTVDDERHIYFTDAEWPEATLTADAAIVYNASKSDKIVLISGFETGRSTRGTFRIDLGDHASWFMIKEGQLFGPGEYSQTDGGLRPKDVATVYDLMLANVTANPNLSDAERHRMSKSAIPPLPIASSIDCYTMPIACLRGVPHNGIVPISDADRLGYRSNKYELDNSHNCRSS